MNQFLNNKGFTFTELMVIISIIAVFTVISFPYYQNVNKGLALDRAAVKLAQDARRAQEMVMSAHKFDDGSGSPPQVPKFYGIYFDMSESNHYILFADIDGDNLYDVSTPCGVAGSECVEDIYLEESVELEECGPAAGICSHLVFFYQAPDPIFYFYKRISGGVWGPSGHATVAYIKLSIDGKEKTINLNKSGLIDIN